MAESIFRLFRMIPLFAGIWVPFSGIVTADTVWIEMIKGLSRGSFPVFLELSAS